MDICAYFHNLHQIIQYLGGIQAIRDAGHVEIENLSYPALGIEVLGEGLTKPLKPSVTCNLSVHQIIISKDKTIRIPEVTFDYWENSKLFLPTGYRKKESTAYQDTIWNENGVEIKVCPGEQKSLLSFCHTWQTTLKNQGFVDIAMLRNGTPRRFTWLSKTAPH